MNRMLDPLGFDAALKKADFPQPIRTGLKRLFGFKRMGHFKAVLRRFNKVTQSSNECVMVPLSRWLFDQLSINGLPLDRDDPLRRTRTGAQGSHPAKRGRCQSPSLDGLCGRPACLPIAGYGQATAVRPTTDGPFGPRHCTDGAANTSRYSVRTAD